MNSNNRADLNPRIINPSVLTRPRPQSARYVYVQNNLPPVQTNLNNAPIVQAGQTTNQNSITNKLCKFFKNLLELEREQGRYNESLAVIQKYINKEINIDELGVQLKGNASKASLPDSLMSSLNSNIDDLRREMYYGRVKIDGINPPPENIIDLNPQTTVGTTTTTIIGNTNNSINNSVRLPISQLINQRPVSFPQTNVAPRALQASSTTQQINRPTQIARHLRPAAANNVTPVFSTQPVLNISNTNLRTIAPSSPIRQSFIQNTIPANQIRAVAVPTTALTNNNTNISNNNTTNIIQNNAGIAANAINKPVPIISNSNQSINQSASEELKIEAVTSLLDQSIKQPMGGDTNVQVVSITNNNNNININTGGNTGNTMSNNNVTLPTNILNQTNYRNKIQEFLQKSTETNNNNNTSSNNSNNNGGAVLNISDEALNYLSEAMENFSLSLLEQAAVFACHRQKLFKDDPNYRKIDDVRSQMKYLQDLESHQRQSEEEKQKQELFKLSKSRSKMDNQEQQKIKETVRKIQEHDKNCDEYSRANMTALKAIGNKRKQSGMGGPESGDVDQLGLSGASLSSAGGAPGTTVITMGGSAVKQARFVNPAALISAGVGASQGAFSSQQQAPLGSQMIINQSFITGKPAPRNATMSRLRNKRIILKDFQLVLDQDAKLKRFKTYKKIFSYGRY